MHTSMWVNKYIYIYIYYIQTNQSMIKIYFKLTELTFFKRTAMSILNNKVYNKDYGLSNSYWKK